MRDWLSHRVVSSPDDTALIRAEDGEAWTYTDLDRLVSETAGRLAAHGIETDDRVGVLTPPYVGTVGLVHATMRIGATFVPLGQELTERELAERVERADLDAVVCAEPTETAALGAVDLCDAAEGVPVLSVDDPTAEGVTAVHGVDPEPVEPPAWERSEPLCILFTSGTTGEPKPVPLTAGNVYSSAVASAFRLGVDHGDRWLVSLSLHHMGGLAPVYRSALYGTTLVLREGFDPGGTADDIDTYDVTGISLVPAMLKRMLDRRGTLADTLRVVLLGGAPAPDELLERCHDYSIPVYPTYGMTEAASQIATATPEQTRDRLGTVGRPLFGTDVTVVDEAGTPVDAGETGEIVVSGPTVTPGYVAEPADDPDVSRDAETLDRAAFGPHGLHTGDTGRFDDDGFLSVVGRLDDRIVTGGENVEPGEVGDVLREFSSVEDAAVVGLDDDVWGERVSALLAVGDRMRSDLGAGDDSTESDAGSSVDEEGLVSFARDRLAGFKIPKAVAYVDELPRTVSGTVDREAVRQILRDRGHDPRSDPGAKFEAVGFEPAEPADPDETTEAGETTDPDETTEAGEADKPDTTSDSPEPTTATPPDDREDERPDGDGQSDDDGDADATDDRDDDIDALDDRDDDIDATDADGDADATDDGGDE